MIAAAGATLTLLLGIAAQTATQDAPMKIVVVVAAGVDAGVEQQVRAALSDKGPAVLSADATRTSLASARELGIDCANDDDGGACWRRVAALAHQDAAVVVNGDGAGITLRLLDARADVAPRTASGRADEAAALVAHLLEGVAPSPTTTPATSTATSTTASTSTMTSASTSTATAAPVPAGFDRVSLGITIGAVGAVLAIASGVSAIAIQQTVLEDPSASGATKGTAFGAGAVLIGATVVFAVGAVVGVGIAALGGGESPP